MFKILLPIEGGGLWRHFSNNALYLAILSFTLSIFCSFKYTILLFWNKSQPGVTYRGVSF